MYCPHMLVVMTGMLPNDITTGGRSAKQQNRRIHSENAYTTNIKNTHL